MRDLCRASGGGPASCVVHSCTALHGSGGDIRLRIYRFSSLRRGGPSPEHHVLDSRSPPPAFSDERIALRPPLPTQPCGTAKASGAGFVTVGAYLERARRRFRERARRRFRER